MGEIIIIVVGIMFAVAINNWNEDRLNSQKEIVLLTKLKSEFESNQLSLKSSVNDLEQVRNKLTTFLDLMGPKPDKVEDSVIHDTVANYYWNPSYSPNKVIFDMSQSNGDFNLITNTQLQEKLRKWANVISHIKFMQQAISKHQETAAEVWLDLHSWKSSIASTGELEGVGPSNFPFDQAKLLSTPAIEHAVSMKLTLTHMHINQLIKTIKLQQELIDILNLEIKHAK
ncbi:hypothetical protein FE810_12450 [Thalassotalea litorea]|uniref:Uncharacterized protein n=1 Tax=Thalassotalea litorea TaxID=2020715 RepID=A0A5R9IF38_9GAMM|nr:DUF6090 family protein [Thalassotalea litorea]TLU64114.1 hypothetical protein FE810_12450 [Thalassotalea litorea]